MTAAAFEPPLDRADGRPAVEELVRRELVSMTFDRSRSSNLLSVPVGVLICWLLWGTIDPKLLLGWLGLKVLSTVVRIALTRQYDRAPPQRIDALGRRFEIVLVLDGVVYGLLPLLVLPAGDVVLSVLMTATVIAVAAIGLVVLSMNIRATTAFVVPVMVPAIPLHFLQGTPLGTYLGIGSAVFLFLVIAEGRRASDHTRAMLGVRFRMDELAAERQRALDLAEHTSAVKSRFLATMSHEMRTPLHGILGLARLLRQPDGGHGGSREQRLDTLERTGEHLLGLINDLLDHSRIEGGKIKVQSQPFELAALLLSVTTLVRVSAEEKALALHLRHELPVPCWVRGDPSRVRQVLLNLAGNAVKFTLRGEVTIHARRDASGATTIDVIDTGQGVAPEDRERIFQAFEQADGTFTRRHGGTGLGLTISRELARAMGGDVVCLPNAPRGSIFRFTLVTPTADAPRQILPTADGSVDAVRLTGRVLLAEDNEVNAMVAQAQLSRLGLSVTLVADGEQATQRVQAERFDLILMDCQMPNLDGFTAAARIRALERDGQRERTPIIALTANAMPHDRQRSLAAGMDEHLPKPYRECELVNLLQRYLPVVESGGAGR